jgi:hypothetical protein
MKTFKEMKEELKKNVKTGKKGNKIHSFSKSDFNSLINSMINDVAYTMDTVKIVDGVITNCSIPVVEEVRQKIILPVLIKAGVEKKDAEELAMTFKYSNYQTACLYDFIADALYQYMDAGKKFNFPNRKDFTGSIHLKEIDDDIVERDIRDIKDHKTVIGHKKEKRESHKTIVKKSSCPGWMRHVL